jgi:hypothetical protein
LDLSDAKARLLKCLDGNFLQSSVLKNPAAFGGRASARAAVAIRAARSAGPTVSRAARMSRSKAINAPKIQLPKSSSQGVIRSTMIPNPLRVCLNVSSGVGGIFTGLGGRRGTRTLDLLDVNQAL